MAEYFDAIANWFINKSIDEDNLITPLKLQQLVYLSNCWHLGIRDEPLITQHFEAWKYGPVLQDLYYKYRHLGKYLITNKEVDVPLDDNKIEILEFCWDKYSFFNEKDLTVLTNCECSPWYHVRGRYRFCSDYRIPNEVIQKFYKMKYQSLVKKPL